MKRTQVSLSKLDYDLAKNEAKRLGISLAELFRRGLKLVISNPSQESLKHKNYKWMNYAGMVSSGDFRSSESVDDVVYGKKP